MVTWMKRQMIQNKCKEPRDNLRIQLIGHAKVYVRGLGIVERRGKVKVIP